MGFMTLTDFREELQSALGGRGFDNSRMDRWINFGYLDLAGALNFDELEDDDTIPTVIGTPSYAVPTGAANVSGVIDDTNENLLRYIGKHEYYRLPRTTTGTPARWTKYGGNILVHPTPDAVVSLIVLFKKEPTHLEADADVTILSDTWDAAVHLLSVHHALMAVGEDNRSIAWFNRAIAYIKTRVSDEEMFVTGEGLGLTMAVPMERKAPAMQDTQDNM